MDVDWHAELLAQLNFYWETSLRPRLDGLTDAEYLWEPAPDCWSVHPDGAGGATIDWAWPEPVPPPVTTIAWRMCHIASGVFAVRTSNHFGDGSVTMQRTDWPLTARGGIDFLADAYRGWVDAVAEAGAARLTQRCGPAEGPYAEYPFATLVLHLNREVMHQGGEIGVLRDLYRAR